MNFFEHQSRAQRNTSMLVVYFSLAVLGIVALTTFAIYLFLAWNSPGQYHLNDWIHSEGFAWTCVLTIGVMVAGTLSKFWQLRNGGEALADMLGATEVLPDARTAKHRVLRNVVEEMAIASGIPAPRTYELSHEQAINAFVAGYRPSEAVVIVTHGTLEQLSRDELQGVIAHEFSHIFNADMRLNLRLMAMLAGILAIGKIGEFLLRGNRHRSYSRSNNKNQGAAIALGLGLMVIGYTGLFFGRLIKAAISRQRELLADASAVQFTRNPAGLAGALISIRNHSGSHLDTIHAEDMSHMCFAMAVPFTLKRLLATHPPIDERLLALGPDWAARARVRQRDTPQTETTPPADERVSGFASGSPQTTETFSPSNRIGTVDAEQIHHAQTLVAAIPESVKQCLHTPAGAQKVVYALALCSGELEPEQRISSITQQAEEQTDLLALMATIQNLGPRLRLPLLDLAIPALKQFCRSDRDALCEKLNALVRDDGKIDLFEFALTQLVSEHLGKSAGRALRIRFRRYHQVAPEIQLLLSLMIHVSGARNSDALALFEQVRGVLLPPGRTLLDAKRCTAEILQKSLRNLRDLTPLLKGPLVDTLADIMRRDGIIQVAEMELLRAVCSLIECPLPPLPGTVNQSPNLQK